MPNLSEMTPAEIDAFLPTVRYWARHYAHRSNLILDYDDLVVVGLMGLLDAARRYNPQRDVMFKTYAEFRIRGEIIDELRRQDWMSRSERRKQKQFRRAQHDLQQDLGRTPTRVELAKVLPFPVSELDRMHQYDVPSLSKSYQEGDLREGEEPRDTLAESIMARDEVQGLMSTLPELHRLILQRRYFDDASLSEISREINLTEGRVSQLHTQALALLRKASRAA